MFDWMTERRRAVNLAAAAGCVFLIAFAYYLELVHGMAPCPLCIVQRGIFLLLGVGFLVAGLHAPHRARWYAAAVGAIAALGVAVAGRHLWLQSLPPERVPACGPGLGYMLEVFPLLEVARAVLTGSGECAEVERWLGASIPAWSLAAFLLLGALAIAANLRRTS